jgi:hypothetical protein
LLIFELTGFQVKEKCLDITCPTQRPAAYYWPANDGCFCETKDFFASAWNYILPEDEPIDMTQTKSIFEVERNELLLKMFQDIQAETGSMAFDRLYSAALSILGNKMGKTSYPNTDIKNDLKVRNRREDPSTTSTHPVADDPVPAFVPPPKTDITPALINQSLTVQPQNTAIVGSVIPHFKDCIITFLIQLDGIVANIIPVNASCVFPCGGIGTEPQPNIMLVPKYVRDGTQQTMISNCRCIAINMYDPKIITYWIQNEVGSIFSLVGNNKVFNIDKIDTSAPIALNMIAPPSDPTKRQVVPHTDEVGLRRRQILKTSPCDRRCPEGFEPIPGNLLKSDPECGCLALDSGEVSNLTARGLTEPGPYSATMSKEACEAMKCTNNGDKPPMFNPFSLTCWCTDPAYVEDNASAWTGGTVKE